MPKPTNLHKVGVVVRPGLIADDIDALTRRRPTLLEGMLCRPLDYSAQTRLVATDTGDPDVTFLPEQLAWDLYRPEVVAQLHENRNLKVKQALAEIQRRSEAAWEALQTVTEKTIVLAAPVNSSWRLVAVRFLT